MMATTKDRSRSVSLKVAGVALGAVAAARLSQVGGFDGTSTVFYLVDGGVLVGAGVILALALRRWIRER